MEDEVNDEEKLVGLILTNQYSVRREKQECLTF